MVINMINVSYMMGIPPIAGWFVSFTILMKIDDTSNWGYNGISIYLSIYIYMGILGLFIPLIYQVGERSLVLC